MKKMCLKLAIAMLGTLCLSPVYAADNQESSADWPKTLTAGNQTMTLYQPQVEKYVGNTLDFVLAVGVTENQQTVYGTVTAHCTTDVDQLANTVNCENVTVNNVNFPTVTEQPNLAQQVTQNLNQKSLQLTVDQLQSSLKLAQINQLKNQTPTLEYTPPHIYVATTPTVLVLIDGDPQLRAIPNTTNLMRVINTAFAIILDTQAGTYYLQTDNGWMQASQISGPWSVAQNVPQNILSLEERPAKDKSAPATSTSTASVTPAIIVSTQPAELIQLNGEPQFTPITGGELMYVSNADSDVFYQIKNQVYFVLLSGRWYQSTKLTTGAAWTYVPADQLPTDFANIPEGSAKADVLASVANTAQSQEATIRNQIPQTAKVARATATVDVTYDGTPQFRAIPGTDMQYAINTSFAVILLNGNYYVCYQGVWFIGQSPTGPWTVLSAVPDEIYSIPPSVPVYPVTYTYIYNATPDYVYVGYTGGYLNSYIVNGVVVYGTGYVYQPWIGTVYYGWPVTYGFNFIYGWSLGYWTAHVLYDNPRWYGGGLRIGGYYGPAGWGVGWFGPVRGGVFINRTNWNHWNNHWDGDRNWNVNINKNNFNYFNNSHNVYNRWNNQVVVNQWNQNRLEKFNNKFPNAANQFHERFPQAANQWQERFPQGAKQLQERFPQAANQLQERHPNMAAGKTPLNGQAALSTQQRNALQQRAQAAGLPSKSTQSMGGKNTLSTQELNALQQRGTGNNKAAIQQRAQAAGGTALNKPNQSINKPAVQRNIPARTPSNNIYAGPQGKVYQHHPQQGWQHYNNQQWQSVKPQQVPQSLNMEQQQRARGAQLNQGRAQFSQGQARAQFSEGGHAQFQGGHGGGGGRR